jgi:hypothetical protein
MTDRPSKYLDWTVETEVIDVNGEVNLIEPPPLKKQQGWAFGEVPPYQWFNWLFKQTDQWIKYLDERITSLKSAAHKAPVLTIDTLPAAVDAGKGSFAYVEDLNEGASLAFSDGENWRKISDRTIITS